MNYPYSKYIGFAPKLRNALGDLFMQGGLPPIRGNGSSLTRTLSTRLMGPLETSPQPMGCVSMGEVTEYS